MLRDLAAGHRTIKKWLQGRRLRRRFRETQHYTIDALPEDIVGRVIAPVQPIGEPLLSPLTERKCVYYVVQVHEVRANDLPDRMLATESRSMQFVLEENGHRAIVDPTQAEISIAFDHVGECRGTFDLDARSRAVLEVHSLMTRDWFNTVRLELHEAIIEVGERIAILGSGTREPDPDAPPSAAYRDGGITRLRLTSSAKYPLSITDDPRCM